MVVILELYCTKDMSYGFGYNFIFLSFLVIPHEISVQVKMDQDRHINLDSISGLTKSKTLSYNIIHIAKAL